jgi:hypothetical protein
VRLDADELELLTGRKRFPTFRRPLARSDLRRVARPFPRRAAENLREAVARDRRDIAFDIRWGRAQGLFERWFKPARRHRRRHRARSGPDASRGD